MVVAVGTTEIVGIGVTVLVLEGVIEGVDEDVRVTDGVTDGVRVTEGLTDAVGEIDAIVFVEGM